MELQPKSIQGDLFNELFKDIEIQRLTPDNMEAYKYSEIRYEDLYNFTGVAEMMGMEKGEAIGIEKGSQIRSYEIARNMLNLHISIENIVKATGLTPEEILRDL